MIFCENTVNTAVSADNILVEILRNGSQDEFIALRLTTAIIKHTYYCVPLGSDCVLLLTSVYL